MLCVNRALESKVESPKNYNDEFITLLDADIFVLFECAMPMPCSDHAVLFMTWALHCKCESDAVALCKSNVKDTF